MTIFRPRRRLARPLFRVLILAGGLWLAAVLAGRHQPEATRPAHLATAERASAAEPPARRPQLQARAGKQQATGHLYRWRAPDGIVYVTSSAPAINAGVEVISFVRKSLDPPAETGPATPAADGSLSARLRDSPVSIYSAAGFENLMNELGRVQGMLRSRDQELEVLVPQL